MPYHTKKSTLHLLLLPSRPLPLCLRPFSFFLLCHHPEISICVGTRETCTVIEHFILGWAIGQRPWISHKSHNRGVEDTGYTAFAIRWDIFCYVVCHAMSSADQRTSSAAAMTATTRTSSVDTEAATQVISRLPASRRMGRDIDRPSRT